MEEYNEESEPNEKQLKKERLRKKIGDFLKTKAYDNPYERRRDASSLEEYFSETDSDNIFGDYTDDWTEKLAKEMVVWNRKQSADEA
jgi:hypothetical protein